MNEITRLFKGNHTLLMVICCVVPMAFLAAVFVFNVFATSWSERRCRVESRLYTHRSDHRRPSRLSTHSVIAERNTAG